MNDATGAIDGADTMQKWLESDDYTTIMETIQGNDGRHIAAAVIARHADRWYHEAGIWVVPEHRGNGHGSELAVWINEECERTGIRVFLSPRDDIGRAAFEHIDERHKVSADEITGRSWRRPCTD